MSISRLLLWPANVQNGKLTSVLEGRQSWPVKDLPEAKDQAFTKMSELPLDEMWPYVLIVNALSGVLVAMAVYRGEGFTDFIIISDLERRRHAPDGVVILGKTSPGVAAGRLVGPHTNWEFEIRFQITARYVTHLDMGRGWLEVPVIDPQNGLNPLRLKLPSVPVSNVR